MRLRLTGPRLIAIAIQLGCTVKTPLVEPLTQKGAGYNGWTGDGVIYALPKTAFDVQLAVSRTDLAKPKCSVADLTAKELEALELDPSEIQPQGGTIFAIHSATLTARAVPDPSRVFISRFPTRSGWADSALVVKMGPAGVVEGTEGSAASKAIPVIAKVLELAGKVGAGVTLLGAGTPTVPIPKCKQSAEDFATLARELKAYRRIPTPFPKDTLEQHQKEIKAEQAIIQALFLGKPTVIEGTVVCSVAPNAKGTTAVLDVYPRTGVRPAANVECQMDARFLTPKDYSPTAADKKSSIALEIEVVDNVIMAANAAGGEGPSEAGFFYTVPIRALVSLAGHPKATLAPTSYFLPQLGSVRALPRATGSSPALVVELHPETGALKSVKASNSAADFAGLVGSVTTGTNEVLTALTTRRDKAREAAEEEAAKRDPLALLTREQSMLEAELAIATAKEALRQLAQP